MAALKSGLRGTSCRGFTADTAVRTLKATRRRPDAGIECGKRDDDSHEAEVRAVFEVLSPSTHELDMFGKLDEYRAIPTIQHIVIIEPNAPKAILWSKQGDGSWAQEIIRELSGSIQLTSLEIGLSLADIYDEIEFRAGLKLIGGGQG